MDDTIMRRLLRPLLALALALLPIAAFAQSAVPMPAAKIQLFDNSGAVLNGGLLYSYLPGTTTPLETCADNNLSAGACVTPNTNPVVLGSDGRASVFLRPQVYKFILKTSAGVTLWTADQITSTTYLGSGTASTGTFLRGDYSWSRITTVVTTTAVGTQNNFNPGIVGDTVIKCNNASLLTITGFPAGYDGQRIIVEALSAQVDLPHSNAGSTAGNRLYNYLTSASTSLNLGTATYVYEATSGVWRLAHHEQGASVSYTPTWGNLGTANAIGNGTLSGTYIVQGRRISYHIQVTWGSTTSSGSSSWTFTVPVAADAFGPQAASTIAFDSSAVASYGGFVINNTTSVFLPVTNANPVASVTTTAPFTWATGDVLSISGWYFAN